MPKKETRPATPEPAGTDAETPAPEKDAKFRNIYQRMHAIMADVRYLHKDKQAPGAAGGYRYISHDQVTRAFGDACVKHGVYPEWTKKEHDFDVLVSTNSKGDEIHTIFSRVVMQLVCVNIDNPEDRTTPAEAVGYGLDRQDKSIGKAISYACKYLMLKACCIETGDDPEADDINHEGRARHTRPSRKNKEPESTTAQTRQQVAKYVAAMGFDLDLVKNTLINDFNVHAFDDLSAKDQEALVQVFSDFYDAWKAGVDAGVKAGMTSDKALDAFNEYINNAAGPDVGFNPFSLPLAAWKAFDATALGEGANSDPEPGEADEADEAEDDIPY